MRNTRLSIPTTLFVGLTLLAGGATQCQADAAVSSSNQNPAEKTTLNPNSWQMPLDVQPAPQPDKPISGPHQSDYLNLGWETFVALNWPALSATSGGSMGQPDTQATIGATAANGAFTPTVWRTFRDLGTIMLANGADPGIDYNQPAAIPGACGAMGDHPVAPGFQPMFIDGSTFQQAPIVKDYINQATGNPLVDQQGWYTVTDILLNPSEYTYIQKNSYYKGENQIAAFKKDGKLMPFPKTGQEYPLPPYAQYGALEVKAAWRVLDPEKDRNIIPRYYTQWGYFMQPDGKTCQGPTLFGLIGLHILRLTPSMGSTWFWASFEQIDNTSASAGAHPTLAPPNTPNGNCTAQYNKAPPIAKGNIPWSNSNTPNNLCAVTPIPADVQQANQSWQQQLQGTVWQYYQMVNTLNPCPSGDSSCYAFPPIKDKSNTINLDVLANTAIESYKQKSNCMDCHGYATGQGAPTKPSGTNQIFTFVLQNAYFPQATPTAASRVNFSKLFLNPPRGKVLSMPTSKALKSKY